MSQVYFSPNFGVLAGFSVHQEMKLWQQAGVPAADVLRYATVEPAKFLGVDSEYGSIEKGKRASFFLTRKNPLDDIDNVAEIESMFVQGEYLNRSRLDEMLAQVKRLNLTKSALDSSKLKMKLEGTVVAESEMTLMYQQWASGSERFRITKDGNRFGVESIVQNGTWDVPFRASGTISLETGVHSLRWESITKMPVVADLKIVNQSATIVVTLDGLHQEFIMRDVNVNDLFDVSRTSLAMQLARFKLDVGQQQRVRLNTWNPTGRTFDSLDCALKRLPQETLQSKSGKVDCTVLEIRAIPPSEAIVWRYWITSAGVLQKQTQQQSNEQRSAIVE